MSKLQSFLNPTKAVADLVEERVISDRFIDEDGDPIPFKVRAISQELNAALIQACTHSKKGRSGQMVESLNRNQYQNRLVVECCVEPDFKLTELCQNFNVIDPYLVPSKMLTTGEYNKLVQFILEVNQFKDGEEIEEDAKNS